MKSSFSGTVRTVTTYLRHTPGDIAKAALATRKLTAGNELIVNSHVDSFIIRLDAQGLVILNALSVRVPTVEYNAPVVRMNLSPETLAKLQALREELMAEQKTQP